MTKKNFFNICFLLLVVFLTLYSVFSGEDLGQIFEYLREGDVRLWILGVITVIIFIECESVRFGFARKAKKPRFLLHSSISANEKLGPRWAALPSKNSILVNMIIY